MCCSLLDRLVGERNFQGLGTLILYSLRVWKDDPAPAESLILQAPRVVRCTILVKDAETGR